MNNNHPIPEFDPSGPPAFVPPWAGKTACDHYTPSRPKETHVAASTSEELSSCVAVVFPLCTCGVPYPLHKQG